MSDIVGSASYVVQPEVDVAAFAGLDALIAAALESAVSSVASIGADIGAALFDPINSAIADAADAAAAGGDEIGTALADATATGIDAAVTSVDGLSDEFMTVADEITGATQGMADEIDSSMNAAFADAAASASVAASDMGDSLRDSIAPAIEDSSGRGRDELGRFVQSSTEAGDDAGRGISQGVRAGADQMVDTVQTASTQVAAIMAGVFAGNELTNVFDGIVSGIQDVVTALPSLGGEFHSAFAQIRVGTGETGVALDSLKADFEAVAARTPASFDAVSQAVTVLNQRLDLTGVPLQDLAYKFVTFSRITNTDLASNLQTVTGVFNNFNITAGEQGNKLNELLRVYQRTGVPVSTLTSSMASLGPVAREVGLSFENTASLVGQLGRAGLDAGTIQMGLTRIMKQATKDHVGFATELQNVFNGVKNGTIDQVKAMDLFGPRGVKLFDLIRSGTLDYKEMSAAIAAGGDTIESAATDVSSWQAQLGILGNQLRLVLEPIATFVFTRITDAMRALRPVILGVAEAVMTILAPAWQGLVVTLSPLWALLDRVRQGVDAFSATFDGSAPVIDVVAGAISNFVEIVTGSRDTGNSVADWVQTIIDTFARLWAALGPVRDLVSSVFDTIRTAIGDFVAANPGPILVGLAVIIGGVVVAAFGALAGVLVTVLAPVAGFIAGLLAVPVALGLVVTALLAAYNNIQPFHDAVSGIATTIAANVVPWVQNAAVQFGNLIEVFRGGNDIAQGVGEVLDNIFGNTGALVAPIRDLTATFMGLWSSVSDAVTVDVLPALQRLWDTLGGGQGVVTWIADHWQILAGILMGPVSILVLLYVKFQAVRDVISEVAAVLGPFIGETLGHAIDVITGLVQVVQGLFTLDWSKLSEGLASIGGAILGELGTVTGQVGPAVIGIAQSIIQTLLGALSNIPILGNLFAGISTIVGGLADVLRGVFDVIAGILTLDWSRIVTGLGGALGGIRDALAGVLGGLGGFLHDLLAAALPLAWRAITEGVPALLGAFGTLLSNLPGWIVTALGQLGEWIVLGLGAAWDWVVANGPTILANVAVWVAGLADTILGWLGDLGPTLLGWLGNAFTFAAGAAGTLLGDLVSFVTGIPQMLLDGLSAYVSFMLTFMYNAISWTVTNLPGIIEGIINFFTSIPGRLGDAMGNLGEWLVNNVFIPAGLWLYLNLPNIIEGVLNWFADLPNKIIDTMLGLGIKLLGWLADAFNWVTTNAPGLITGLVDFFNSIPGKLFDAVVRGVSAAGGAIASLATSLWNGLADFLNDKLINPFRNFKVSIGPQTFTPFEFIPPLQKFARGYIADQPTLGIFGEAGREALVPLDDAAAGVAVARAAGIPQMLAGAGDAPGGATVNLNLYLTVPPGTSAEDAKRLGAAAAAGAGDELDRNATIRSLMRGAA